MTIDFSHWIRIVQCLFESGLQSSAEPGSLKHRDTIVSPKNSVRANWSDAIVTQFACSYILSSRICESPIHFNCRKNLPTVVGAARQVDEWTISRSRSFAYLFAARVYRKCCSSVFCIRCYIAYNVCIRDRVGAKTTAGHSLDVTSQFVAVAIDDRRSNSLRLLRALRICSRNGNAWIISLLFVLRFTCFYTLSAFVAWSIWKFPRILTSKSQSPIFPQIPLLKLHE